MANQEDVFLLKQGVDVWNRWRRDHPERRPDLSRGNLNRGDLLGTPLYGADLSFADLSEADLSFTYLNGANLSQANLSGANLSGANLNEIDLNEAELSQANLSRANLFGASLIRANLFGANLNRANLNQTNLSFAELNQANLSRVNLNRADLSNAQIGWTTFADVDLSETKGLETVKHRVPSSIGIDTVLRSQGKIPDSFLQGAGISDTVLDYLHVLVNQPIQYFTCFISHSHRDQTFCDRLYVDLQANGVRAWYFLEDATWGKTIWGEIDRSIKIYDKLVVVCSEYSLQSLAVQREIERALQREDREGKNILFPLRLDNYLFEQWEHERKADVVNKVVGDFRGWDSIAEQYHKAFQRFLKALKAEEATAT